MSSSNNVSRPAWWPTEEQKERADKACADAQAATTRTVTEEKVPVYLSRSALLMLTGNVGEQEAAESVLLDAVTDALGEKEPVAVRLDRTEEVASKLARLTGGLHAEIQRLEEADRFAAVGTHIMAERLLKLLEAD
jgi:hypothetical protein